MALAESASRFELAPRRENFSHIPEVLPLPNLIQTQTDSFEWFVTTGLRELLDEITPITDFTGKNLELHFREFYFEEPKFSEEECRTRDLTYARPLKVEVDLVIKETDEVKHQTVFMGDFPWMTDQGTFIINGAERVVVSQLVRSPGVYYTAAEDPSTGRHAARRQGDPEPRRLARVRDLATRTCSASRSTASARSRSPRCCAPSASRPVRSSTSSPRPTTTRSIRMSRSRWRRIRPGTRTRRSSRSTRSCAPAIRRPSRTRAPSSPASSSTSAATTSVASAATS